MTLSQSNVALLTYLYIVFIGLFVAGIFLRSLRLPYYRQLGLHLILKKREILFWDYIFVLVLA